MLLLRCLCSLLLGYLCGSFPSGVLIGRWRGVDVRRYGSGRTGATNVARTLGGRYALLVALLDLLKGALPVALTRHVFCRRQPWTETCAGIGAILGHNHSLFLRFRGGRGVLTATGAMLAINPLPLLPAAVCAYIPIKLTRYISLGSMTGAVCTLPFHFVLVASKRDSWAHFAYPVASAAIIIAEHYDNIQRLLAGTERKVGEKVTLPTPTVQTPTFSGKPSLPAHAR